MKNLCLIVVIITSFFACNYRPSENYMQSLSDTDKVRIPKNILNRSDSIHEYFQYRSRLPSTFAKVKNKDSVIKIDTNKCPYAIDCYYNIYRDTTGKIVLIKKIPFCASGDWSIEYNHYFASNGKTILFERLTNTLYRDLSIDTWREVYEIGFDTNFNPAGKYYYLTDKRGCHIKYDGQLDSLRLPYDVYKNVEECLAGYHMKLKK